MKKKLYTSIGLMSGTSMDGVDLSIISSDGYDEFSNILDDYYEYDKNLKDQLVRIRDLVITKKDLSKKHYDNINQVGYKVPYQDEDEINGLIYYYYKKCVEWYDRDYYSFGTESLNLPDAAKAEARLIIKDEKDNGNTSLAILYCEGTYVWSLGR